MISIINRQSLSQNVPGIAEIKLIPVSYVAVTALPRINQTLRSKVLNLSSMRLADNVSEVSWFKSKFIREECSWVTDEDDTNQGPLYKEKLTWTVARNYDLRKAGFDDMEGREFLVIVIDANDNHRLLGHVTFDGEIRGMRFSKKRTTGAKYSDRNFYTLEMYMESHAQPWVLDPAITIATI